MAKYIELAGRGYSEDQRIEQIGQASLTGKRVAFCTDDEPGKADRYIRKLLERFPKLKDAKIEKLNGPTPGVVSVIVQLKQTEE